MILGTALLGHCDDLAKIKQICHEHNLWLHVMGDLLGSLALLSVVKENMNINCDSVTIDIVKIFGIQNLPYLTFFIRPVIELKQDKQIELNSASNEGSNTDILSAKSTTSANMSLAGTNTTLNINNNPLISHSFDEVILHSPSITFLSVWSISQRCSHNDVLYHMKRSIDLSNLLVKSLKQIKTLRFLIDDNPKISTYKCICSGDAPDEPLPKTVIIFRFEANDIPQVSLFLIMSEY